MTRTNTMKKEICVLYEKRYKDVNYAQVSTCYNKDVKNLKEFIIGYLAQNCFSLALAFKNTRLSII